MSHVSDNNEKYTPMIRQYLELKKQHKDYILFYRLGDFYEMFFEDAVEISKVLELTLTSRAGTPMCGVPHHSSENYIKRLTDRGYGVAIAEQVGNPAEKGIFERQVVRIITKGTVYEDSMLEEGKNNFLACFYADGENCGMAFADISTSEMHSYEKSGSNIENELIAEISRYQPVEYLFNEAFMDYKKVHQFIKQRFDGCTGQVLPSAAFDTGDLSLFKSCFGDMENQLMRQGLTAVNAVLGYVKETQKDRDIPFTRLTIHTGGEAMGLNLTTRRNLELTETMRSKERRGSLMWVLDKTCTAMGKRKLKRYIEQPLVRHIEILKRLEAVDELKKDITRLHDLRGELGGIYDLERLMTRIVYKAASPRDVFSLGRTCARLPAVKALLCQYSAPLLRSLDEAMEGLDEIKEIVERAIIPEPPAITKDGNYIRQGYNDELDRLRAITRDNKDILDEIEAREKAATGIKNLRVGYNRVFGYYIEVSKGNTMNVPASYVRKQTLTNGERYITDELKKIEIEIIGANDRILALEAELFAEVRAFIAERIAEIQRTADAVAALDVLGGFAEVAIENNYARPEITLENVVEIRDGRHPVIEKMLHAAPFTPNDTYLDTKENRLIILTGPNMAGKSTYMRQVALIVLMAQIGSFVPARSARIGVVDQIFTRVGASDDLSAGQSTFMVEMSEVAEILENATPKSLVILDEIGRGTSTYDGISIAKSVADYINSKVIGCKTLFATHYHELIGMEKTHSGIRNFSVAVSKRGEEIQFLHKIVEGGVDDSYGIEVAKLAGLPKKVISTAKTSLKAMERGSKIELEAALLAEEESETQIDFTTIAKEKAINRLRTLDINSMTPMEAMQTLAELKDSIE